MGYRNPVITHHFPDLVDDGDDVYVTIRNPLIMAPGELTSAVADVQADDGDQVVLDEKTTTRTWELAAKLIVGWRMYDATFVPQLDDKGEPVAGGPEWPLLPVTPSAADVGKAPMGVITWIAEQIGRINPQLTPASQGGTSSES